MGGSQSGRGLHGMMLALIIFSLAYGSWWERIAGSSPPPGRGLRRCTFSMANDQRLMMWIAIGIGAAHLIYANLAFAWWRRHSPTAISPLAWAVIIPAGFSVGLATSNPALPSLTGIGLWTFAAGALLVLLITSERPFSLSPGQLFGPRWSKKANGILQCFWRLPQLLAALRSGAGVDQARRPSTAWQRPPLQRATCQAFRR